MKCCRWIFGVLTFGLLLPSLHSAESPKRPNILFILTDDQRWDAAGFACNEIIHTPHMDRLSAEGVTFRNAFVTTSICAASRATILTGLYERTHRYTFNTPPIQNQHAEQSYPAMLRQAGYRTGFVGKFGVNVNSVQREKMFDYFVPLNRNPYFKKESLAPARHVTDITGDKAILFLDSIRKDQSFCLSVSFNAPHAEDSDPRQYIWPPSADGLYRDVTFPVPKTMTNGLFESLPEFLKDTESRVRYHWRFDEPEKYQDMVRGYYRMISGVDAVIGRLRKELEQRGLAENTVIIFTSDNGYFLGERGFADKWYLHEHSSRVPMVIYDPRLPANRRGEPSDLLALNVDMAPTILAYAGVTVPQAYQGHSLIPLMKGKVPKEWRYDFFYEHLFERWNIPKSEGVRNHRWTYIRWFEQEPVFEELYDHQADFEQQFNLAKAPDYAEVLQSLRQRTDQLRNQYGGPYQPNYLRKSEKPAGQEGSRSN